MTAAVGIDAYRRIAGPPLLSVDLAAIAANTRLFTACTTAAVMAVVKADGFGQGAVDVGRTALANGATPLGVASLEEALPLRHAGIRAPLLSWLNHLQADFGAATGADIDLAVPSLQHLESIARTKGRSRIHLHLDTGMARDAAAPSEWAYLCRAARALERTRHVRVVGVVGHLGCADDPEDDCNKQGQALFEWGVDVALAAGLRPSLRHLAATAATLTDPGTHHTLCRIGAGLVGIDPSGTTRLHPALTLTAPVVSVRDVPTGTPVGYGHTWTEPQPSQLG